MGMGPMEAFEVVNRAAMVFIPSDATLLEGMAHFAEAVQNLPLAKSMQTAAAFSPKRGPRWFDWADGLRGLRTELGGDAAAQLERRSENGPHMRCDAHAVARQGTVGKLE